MEKTESTWTDYSHEVRPLRSKWQRNLLLGLGTFFFILAILGIFLPILPTTPFLLLTAACYGRASTKFYNWLMNHYLLGPYIRDSGMRHAIPRRAKITALLLMEICFGISATFFVTSTYPRIGFLSIGVVVAFYILRLPTRTP